MPRNVLLSAFISCLVSGMSAAGQYDAPAYTDPPELKSAEQLNWEELVYPKYKAWPAMRYVQEEPDLPRALLIGDSISIGYTTRVQENLKGKVNVWRAPVNAGSTETGLEQLDQWLSWRDDWDVIHFNWGLHDLKRRKEGSPNPDQLDVTGKIEVPMEEYAANLEKLVARLEQTGAKLIWAATTPIGEGSLGRIPGDEVAYNKVAAEIMKKHGIQIDDLYAYILPDVETALNPQDVHFQDPGNDLLAKKIAAEILQAMEAPVEPVASDTSTMPGSNAPAQVADLPPASAQLFDCKAVADGTVRDHLWLWSHFAGAYNGGLNPVPGNSSFSALDGAKYMGIPNVIFIQWLGVPSSPFVDYAAPFADLKRLMWSAFNNDGEVSSLANCAPFLELAEAMPNVTAAFMDDFFHGTIEDPAKVPANLTTAELDQLRGTLKDVNGRSLDLGVVIYAKQLSPTMVPYLAKCDLISLWTWKSEDLAKLEANFDLLRNLAPTQRVFLGCYMWDFGDSQPMPVERMELQCRLGLSWLKNGDIDGIIFLGANLCDRNLEAVEWTRRWISEVGEQSVAAL